MLPQRRWYCLWHTARIWTICLWLKDVCFTWTARWWTLIQVSFYLTLCLVFGDWAMWANKTINSPLPVEEKCIIHWTDSCVFKWSRWLYFSLRDTIWGNVWFSRYCRSRHACGPTKRWHSKKQTGAVWIQSIVSQVCFLWPNISLWILKCHMFCPYL